jgi:hypothetical protein
MQIERRYQNNKLKIQKRADGGVTIAGYPAVFNVLSVNLGGFREKIEPGAFANTIKADDIRALLEHDSSKVLGRVKNGTLRLAEDDVGLRMEIDPPDTQVAKDLIVNLERGDIDQGSFGFRVNPKGDRWGEDPETGTVIRTLLDVKLFDVSPTTFPAYPQTSVGLRALLGDLTPGPSPKTGEGGGGVSVETVYRALYRAEFGGLEAEDLSLLKALEQSLKRLSLTDVGQAPGSESDGQQGSQAADYAAMRRQLELMEIEI